MSRLHIKLPEENDNTNEVMVEFSSDMEGGVVWDKLVELFGINILKSTPVNIDVNGYNCVRRVFECDEQTINEVSMMLKERANQSIIESIEINKN